MSSQNVFLPSPALRPFIWRYNLIKSESAVKKTQIPPTLSSGLAFLLEGTGHIQFQDKEIRLPDNYIIPVTDHPFLIESSEGNLVLGIQFFPGKFSEFFGWPQRLFFNTSVGLEETEYGKSFCQLKEQLYETKELPEKILLIDHFLLRRMPEKPIFRPVMDFILHEIYKSRGQLMHDELSRRTGMSGRSLRRLFLEHTGMNARTFMRIFRFYHAFMLLNSRQFSSLTDLAYSAGYFDQAHFIHDFHAFTGASPNAFLKNHPGLAGQLGWETPAKNTAKP